MSLAWSLTNSRRSPGSRLPVKVIPFLSVPAVMLRKSIRRIGEKAIYTSSQQPFRIRNCPPSHYANLLYPYASTCMYSRITSIKAPSCFMPNIVASLTSLTPLLLLSHDCRCCVSRPVLASPALWLQKHTDLRAHDFAHSHDLWHRPRLANITRALTWRLCGIARSMVVFVDFTLITACCDLHWHTTWPGIFNFDEGAELRAGKEVPWIRPLHILLKLLGLPYQCTLPYYHPFVHKFGVLPHNIESERTCWSCNCVGTFPFLFQERVNRACLWNVYEKSLCPFVHVCAVNWIRTGISQWTDNFVRNCRAHSVLHTLGLVLHTAASPISRDTINKSALSARV